eukprot:13573262-Ditylum_brightwellii.AAC.1
MEVEVEVEGEKEREEEVVQSPSYNMVGAEGGVLARWGGGHGGHGGHGKGKRRGGGQKRRAGGGDSGGDSGGSGGAAALEQLAVVASAAAPVPSADAVETAEDAGCHLFDCLPSFDELDNETDELGGRE